MTRRTNKKPRGEDNPTKETIKEFVERELPPAAKGQVPHLTDAVRRAGLRYDRYAAAAARDGWLKYRKRRLQLEEISESALKVVNGLAKLDCISRDVIESCLDDPTQMKMLPDSLCRLRVQAMRLAQEVQRDGKPRDLAEERWIFELADIYENAFRRTAKVSGSGSGPTEKRGRFYRFLELSRPESFPRYGKLSVRQVERTLRRRNKKTTLII